MKIKSLHSAPVCCRLFCFSFPALLSSSSTPTLRWRICMLLIFHPVTHRTGTGRAWSNGDRLAALASPVGRYGGAESSVLQRLCGGVHRRPSTGWLWLHRNKRATRFSLERPADFGCATGIRALPGSINRTPRVRAVAGRWAGCSWARAFLDVEHAVLWAAGERSRPPSICTRLDSRPTVARQRTASSRWGVAYLPVSVAASLWEGTADSAVDLWT